MKLENNVRLLFFKVTSLLCYNLVMWNKHGVEPQVLKVDLAAKLHSQFTKLNIKVAITWDCSLVTIVMGMTHTKGAIFRCFSLYNCKLPFTELIIMTKA